MSIAAALILMTLGQAADVPKLDEKQLVKLLEPYYLRQAAKYEFFLDDAWKLYPPQAEPPKMRRRTSSGNSRRCDLLGASCGSVTTTKKCGTPHGTTKPPGIVFFKSRM